MEIHFRNNELKLIKYLTHLLVIYIKVSIPTIIISRIGRVVSPTLQEKSGRRNNLPFISACLFIKTFQWFSFQIIRSLGLIDIFSTHSVILKNKIVSSSSKVEFWVLFHQFCHSVKSILSKLVTKLKPKLKIHCEKENLRNSIFYNILLHCIKKIVHRAKREIEAKHSRRVSSHRNTTKFLCIKPCFVTL